MDLPIPTIYGSISKDNFPTDMCGSPSSNVQQLLLTAYAPKISVVSSTLADSIATSFGKIENIQHLFSYFENIFAFGSNYNTEIYCTPTLNNSPTTLSGSGCVRFVNNVFINANNEASPEFFDLNTFSNDLKTYVEIIDNKIKSLSNSTTIDEKLYSKDYDIISKFQNSIYLKLIALLNSTEKMSSFECFNHPIMQLVVISGNDSKETIEKLVSNLDSTILPQWYDKSSTLQHIIILSDQDDSEMLQKSLKIQEDLKVKSGKRSTIVNIDMNANQINESDTTNVTLLPSLFCNIKRNSQDTITESLLLSNKAFNLWKRPLQDIISKDLIIFMNTKIKEWNDEVVVPRTSLTGRIFGGRKWGGNKSNFFSFGSNQSSEDNIKETNNNSKDTYNSEGGYYYAQSPEMILRKLADWYFMLGDYKNAYTTYGLIKKNMINDKAFAHLSSLQEYTVFSLLLGASSKSGAGSQSITPKMISTVISPMLDSSFYSYLSRCNLITYTLRLTIIAAELYFYLGQTLASNLTDDSNRNIEEIYYSESISMFKKVIDSNLLDKLSNGYMMQRIAYIYSSYDRSYTNPDNYVMQDPSYYETENPGKIYINSPNLRNFGQSRNRRLILWLVLSINEIDPMKQPLQSQLLIWRIQKQIELDGSKVNGKSWLQRNGGLLSKIKEELQVKI